MSVGKRIRDDQGTFEQVAALVGQRVPWAALALCGSVLLATALGFAAVTNPDHAPLYGIAFAAQALAGIAAILWHHTLRLRERELEEEVERRREAQCLADEEAYIGRALADVGRELIAGLDEPALLERLGRVSSRVLEADLAATFLFDADLQTYCLAASTGLTPAEEEVARVVVLPRQVLEPAIARLAIDSLVLDGILGLPATASYFGMAIRHGEEVIGVLVAGWRGASHPVTDRRVRIARGISGLASLAHQNARIVDELERANRVKSDFVSTMSHELRTPIHIVLGYVELLLDGGIEGPLSAEQREALERIDERGRDLFALINTTLDLSRLESADVTMSQDRVVVDDLFSMLREDVTVIDKPELTFHWNASPGLPPLLTDRRKLAIAIRNLVSNAAKFTDDGDVFVSARAKANGVEIAVRDTGIGIAPEALSAVFEPFRQLESSLTRRHAGVGLGLYIVQRLVGLLGGEITLTSTLGVGSTFKIWIPERPSVGKPEGVVEQAERGE